MPPSHRLPTSGSMAARQRRLIRSTTVEQLSCTARSWMAWLSTLRRNMEQRWVWTILVPRVFLRVQYDLWPHRITCACSYIHVHVFLYVQRSWLLCTHAEEGELGNRGAVFLSLSSVLIAHKLHVCRYTHSSGLPHNNIILLYCFKEENVFTDLAQCLQVNSTRLSVVHTYTFLQHKLELSYMYM